MPLEPLLDALHDKNEYVRSAAVRALGGLGERVPLEPLLDALHDEGWDVRMAAVRALGGLGERVPLEPLLEALYDENEYIRMAAARALGKLGERVPLEPLLALVRDLDRLVASTAIEVLKKRDPAILSPMITEAKAILQGQSPGEFFSPLSQNFITDVIGSTGVASSLFFDALRPILNSASWQARLSAIRALGRIRRSIPDDIIQRLLELRYDADPKMRVQRETADETLFEILSLETGIEDD